MFKLHTTIQKKTLKYNVIYYIYLKKQVQVEPLSD